MTEVQPGNELLRVKCLVFSRVVGYLTPVSNWNTAKQHEFHERHLFDRERPDFDLKRQDEIQDESINP